MHRQKSITTSFVFQQKSKESEENFFFFKVFNPFIVSYPCSAHTWVLPKHRWSAAQKPAEEQCSIHITISHFFIAIISRPHNWSGSFLYHFKEHRIQINCVLVTRPQIALYIWRICSTACPWWFKTKPKTLQAITKQTSPLNHLSQYFHWIPHSVLTYAVGSRFFRRLIANTFKNA